MSQADQEEPPTEIPSRRKSPPTASRSAGGGHAVKKGSQPRARGMHPRRHQQPPSATAPSRSVRVWLTAAIHACGAAAAAAMSATAATNAAALAEESAWRKRTGRSNLGAGKEAQPGSLSIARNDGRQRLCRARHPLDAASSRANRRWFLAMDLGVHK